MKKLTIGNAKKLISLLLAFSFIALTACSSSGGTAATNPPAGGNTSAQSTNGSSGNDGDSTKTLFDLRVVDPPVDYLEFVTAWELGFFEDAGINIVFVGELSGITNYQAIEQGIIDASYSGHPSGVAQARIEGLKVTMIAPGMIDTPTSPHVTYLVKKDSPLKTLDDLKGASVGIDGIGACTSGYVEFYQLSNGLTTGSLAGGSDEYNFVTFGDAGTMEQAVLQGDIDVSTSHTPYAEITLATGEVRALGTTYDIFQSGAGGLGARVLADRVIVEHPEVAQGFVDAMYRARLWTNDHFEQAGDLVAAVLGLEKGDVLAIIQDDHKNVSPEYLDIWFDMGILTGLWNPGDIEKDEIYTNEFVPADAPASDKTLEWDGVPNRVFHQD
ncbi:MAG: ABC transporter substrate-binding protein [Oscillospiraceae bacterium]|jgi:ABC-type nitrate/sulfonate/bicarbonate transport system substrate-binding protein|nr:ABC transporter substrate-binding protein [Oscillospiraceae bacterium]